MKYLLLLLFLFGCSSYQRIETLSNGDLVLVDQVQTVQTSSFAPLVQPEEIEHQEVEVNKTDKDLELIKVKSFKGFTDREIEKFWQASKTVNKVTHSKCFEKYITDFKDLLNNKSQTRAELIEELRSSKPEINFVMYYKNNSTVGYTYGNSDTIWMNRKFHGNYSLAQASANLGHERSHKLGYGHDFKNTSRRSRQTPYPIGAAIRACANDINYELSEQDKVRVCYRTWKSWLWIKPVCYWKIK